MVGHWEGLLEGSPILKLRLSSCNGAWGHVTLCQRPTRARPEDAMGTPPRSHPQSSGYLKIEPVGVRVDIHLRQTIDFARSRK
jgi:hypothetical protein